jgi:hypothetical protein
MSANARESKTLAFIRVTSRLNVFAENKETNLTTKAQRHEVYQFFLVPSCLGGLKNFRSYDGFSGVIQIRATKSEEGL